MTTNRWLTIALIFSLAVNLLLVGIGIGRFLSNPGFRPPMHFGWVMRGLSDDRRAELRPQIEAQIAALAPLRDEMRAAQQQVAATLVDDPFDDQASAAALAALQTASSAMQEAMHQHMIANFSTMSLEERKRAARFMKRRDRHKRPHERPREPRHEMPQAPLREPPDAPRGD